MKRIHVGLFAAAALFSGVPTHAGLIAPVAVSATSELVNSVENRRATFSIDGSGLVAGAHSREQSYIIPGTPARPDILWMSSPFDPNGGTHAEIGWDLGGAYAIDGMHVWNYNGDVLPIALGSTPVDQTFRGVRQADVVFYLNGVLVTTLEDLLFVRAPHSNEYLGEFYSFGAGIFADSIWFRNTSAFAGADVIGLSEIRFSQVASVPEPGTLALLAVGFIGLAACRRRPRIANK